ncbi:MAG: hypothetical protein C5B50_15765 [Verrucomicrobia bacterium]|nr:MAG: hypothetical protein C5B50_15765 [Verrucomicrobiota bacterium]
MSFLEGFIKSTEAEIAAARAKRTLTDLKKMIQDTASVRSFGETLRKGFGLIAEVKKRSPSGGEMRRENFEKAPQAYADSPAVKALSVLTNATHFGMGIEELARIRRLTNKPLLRKDFIFDEYQVYEARAFGADAILLMACVLESARMKGLFELTRELGMDALFEVHDREEIGKVPAGASLYGVNSRNFRSSKFKVQGSKSEVRSPKPEARSSKPEASNALKQRGSLKPARDATDPTVDLQTFSLVQSLPSDVIKVAESGVRAEQLGRVRDMGYNAILVGTSLLKHPAGVEAAVKEFEEALKR